MGLGAVCTPNVMYGMHADKRLCDPETLTKGSGSV
jgi:hypothetical protein